MKIQCVCCDVINPPRARFCRNCGERLSERQPTSIRRVRSEPPDEVDHPSDERRKSDQPTIGKDRGRTVSLRSPLLMVVLLLVAYKAYLELVERTPPAYVGLLGVDALIVALFAAPAFGQIRQLFVLPKPEPRWMLAGALGGVLVAFSNFGSEQFLHWLGEPLRPGDLVWFEEHGSPAWLAVVCTLIFVPLIYEIGWRGYFQTELGCLITPLQASLVTALIATASEMYPQRLPFVFVSALVLSELRRKSSSLLPCVAASCVAGALGLFVLNPGA